MDGVEKTQASDTHHEREEMSHCKPPIQRMVNERVVLQDIRRSLVSAALCHIQNMHSQYRFGGTRRLL